MGTSSVERPSLATAQPEMVGKRLGRYEILQRIAAGGMATVYVARGQGVAGFERLVAIKLLHPHLAHEEEFVSRCPDQARLAARVRRSPTRILMGIGAACMLAAAAIVTLRFATGGPRNKTPDNVATDGTAPPRDNAHSESAALEAAQLVGRPTASRNCWMASRPFCPRQRWRSRRRSCAACISTRAVTWWRAECITLARISRRSNPSLWRPYSTIASRQRDTPEFRLPSGSICR